jgi:hypothetical protein
MQRIASFTLALMLSGCGYKTWWNPPLTGGYNPNMPVSDSENMRRVQGQEPTVPPLTTEPGDIWRRHRIPALAAPPRQRTTNQVSLTLNRPLRYRVMLRLLRPRQPGAKPVKSSRHRSRHRLRQEADQDIRPL